MSGPPQDPEVKDPVAGGDTGPASDRSKSASPAKDDPRVDTDAFKYWAFISYSHADRVWGNWLHRGLEMFAVPRALAGRESRDGKVPRRIFPIFRDVEELPSSASLQENIIQGLKRSRYLIVICSPRAAASRWVNEEIRYFKSLGREDRVLGLIIDGEPNASDKPESGLLECFPPALRFRGEGQERVEPLAADVRPGHGDKQRAKLKLIAGLLGIDFDELWKRDLRRRRIRRLQQLGLAAIALGCLLYWALERGTVELDVVNLPPGLTMTEGHNVYQVKGQHQKFTLPVGNHVLVFQAPGYYQFTPHEVSLERVLLPHSRRTQIVQVELQHEQGTLNAEASTTAAQITIDGNLELGGRIHNLSIDSGRHQAVATAPGHFEQAHTFDLQKGGASSLYFWLEPQKPWIQVSTATQGFFAVVGDVDGDGTPDFLHNYLAGGPCILSGRTGEILTRLPVDSGGQRAIRSLDLGGSIGQVIIGGQQFPDRLDVYCVKPGPKSTVLWQWTRPTQGVVPLRGLAFDILRLRGNDNTDVVIVGSDGKLYRLDGSNGTIKGEYALPVNGQLTAYTPLPDESGEGILFSGNIETGDNAPYTFRIGYLDLAAGKVRWNREITGAFDVRAVDIDGTGKHHFLFWTDTEWTIIDGRTGEVRFNAQLPDHDSISAVCLADLEGTGKVEAVIAYTDKAKQPQVAAIGLDNGQIRWKQPLKLLRPYLDNQNRLWQTPERSLLLALDNGFAALDATDGHILWERAGRLTDALLVTWEKQQSLLLGFQEDGIRCLDLKGNQRWAFGFSEDVGPRLVLTNADGAGHDGVVFSRHAGLIGCLQGPKRDTLWEQTATGPLQARPLAFKAGDAVRVVQLGPWKGGRTIRCFDGATGAEVWSATENFQVNNPPALADWLGNGEIDVIAHGEVLGSGQSSIFVYRGSDGKIVDKIDVSPQGDVYSTPTVADLAGDGHPDFVVTRWWTHDVIAVSSKNHALRWRYDTIDRTFNSVAVADLEGNKKNDVLVPLPGKLVALRGTDGGVLWENAEGAGTAVVVTSDFNGDGIPDPLVVGTDGALRILDGRTGSLLQTVGGRWQHATITSTKDGPTILASDSEGLVAIDWRTQQTKWRSAVQGIPIVADMAGNGRKQIVCVSPTGMATILDLETGEVLWSNQIANTRIESAPTLVDLDGDGIADILIPGYDFRLRAIRGRSVMLGK